MVNHDQKQIKFQPQLTDPTAHESFGWASVPIQSIIDGGLRLDASVYATATEKAKQTIATCKFNPVFISELITLCSYPGRFKRNYQPKNIGLRGFIGSAEMLAINPEPVKWMQTQTETSVRKNQLLLSRSGTIGNVILVNKTLEKFLISEHAIRIESKENIGYLYAFFKSHTGKILVKSLIHGAVINQIEPEHILKLLVPNAPKLLRTHIHHLVFESFQLRDESNDLLGKAKMLLKDAFQLPDVERLNQLPNGDNKLCAFSVNVKNLHYRFEANYHNPLAKAITQHLHSHANNVLSLGESQVTKNIILPGRFKRVYVDEKHGIPFIGGKEILELDPRGEKFLSLKHHGERITNESTLHENMILVTRSGTIGKVNIVPHHWEGWAGSEHILRAIPSSLNIAGYLYAWLSSEWALPLIRRHTYGAVVFEIDQYQLGEVPVPMPKNTSLIGEINTLVLDANKLRYLAFKKEEEALKCFNETVLGLPLI